jgi:hypothetical protein
VPAKIVGYYDYEDEDRLVSPQCGWAGPVKDADMELFKELLEVSCPRCGEMLLIISFPTWEQTEEAARKGNRKALKELPSLRRRQEFLRRFRSKCLKSAQQLPDLEGETLELVWDYEEKEGDRFTVIRIRDRMIWSEPALWEGWARFNDIKAILKEKYGSRFRSLIPTSASKVYLYGDDLSAPRKISYD